MANFNLVESDLLVELFRREPSGNLDEDFAWISQAPVRVTHKPTRISAIGENQGSQIKNKEKAIERLKELLTNRDVCQE